MTNGTPDFLNKKFNLPIFPQENQDPLKSIFELDSIEKSEPDVWPKENPYLKGGAR